MIRVSKRLLIPVFTCTLFISVPLEAQRSGLRDTVAGIPVNYVESNVQPYTLPDPLTLKNGERVEDPEVWYTRRRPEILHDFMECQFGHAPGRPGDMWFDVFDRGTVALDGKAIRKQVRIFFTADTAGPKMDLLLYLPANTTGPVPLLLSLNFVPSSSYINDPGIRKGEMWNREHKRVPAPERSIFGYFDVEPFLEQGIAYGSVYYGDIEPDFLEGIMYGIRAAYLEPGNRYPEDNEWGAIAAWAWGLSRAMDYILTDPDIHSDKVAIFGISRLGKTVLWAGASDQRIAMVIASCSGEGGAALSRRNYGETIAHLTAPTKYPYQFCTNYQRFSENVNEFPVDAHMLVSLVAPRPLLLQTGNTDFWSDPRGEFLSAVAAGPVYKLLGGEDLGTTEMPSAGEAILNTLGYYMHEGDHGPLPSDYPVIIEFIKKHLIK